MSLATLPGELYTHIIHQLDPSSWTQAVLSLSRVLPSAPIPIELLFHSIRVRRPPQAVSLYLRLRRTENTILIPNSPPGERCAAWVKELSVEAWSTDAGVITGLIRLLPNIESLNLRIGSNNFSPEQLEELLGSPIGRLRQLSLRFRPYVDKASYYQFHKGVYFDSALLALARWPPQKLLSISIVQDPSDTSMVSQRRSFAQPIVFFFLDPHLSILLHSPSVAHSLKAVRLNIPSRPVARALYTPPSQTEAFHSPDALPVTPDLEFLDLTTCGVIEGELDLILAHFCNLKHLILDGCAILRTELRQGEWGALGKRCALVGVRRARDRERELKAWLEERLVADSYPRGSDGGPAQAITSNTRPEPRRQRPGRRGLATATISLRSWSPGGEPVPPQPNTPNASRPPLPKIRILPSVPCLETLATTTVLETNVSRHPTIRAEFEAGWAEGIAQLAVTCARMRSCSKNGVRLLRFVENTKSPQSHGMPEDLEDVSFNDDSAFTIPNPAAPILCLAGSRRCGNHVSDCGHAIGWNMWKENYG